MQVLYKFKTILNLIQATVNQSGTLLGYISKQKLNNDLKENEENFQAVSNKEPQKSDNETKDNQCLNLETEYYQAYVIELKTDELKIHKLEDEKSKQVRIQFFIQGNTFSEDR